MQISLFLLFRIAAGVLIGVWLVSKVRNPLRAAVVRLMPMKYRISEKSFIHQARLTTVVSALLAALVAGAVFHGITRAAQMSHVIEKESTLPKESKRSDQSRLGAPAPEEPEQPGPDTVEAAAGAAPDPMPEAAPQTVIVPPKPKSRPEPLVITPETWFLQVHALGDSENAWAEKARLERRCPKKVWVGHDGEGDTPYKLLVGPFAGRAEALSYRKKKKLGGYARPLEDIRLFAR